MNTAVATCLVQIPLFIGCGCDGRSKPPSAPPQAASATQPIHTEETKIGEQPRATWHIQPVMLDHLPDASTIQDIHLVEGLNGSHGGTLTRESFKRLLASAKPVAADPHWAYAPWYSGTFAAPDGTYTFELYLGGRGKLSGPDGKTGLFSFEQPTTARNGDSAK